VTAPPGLGGPLAGGSPDGGAARPGAGSSGGRPSDPSSDGSLGSHGAGGPPGQPPASPSPGGDVLTLRPGDALFPKALLTIRPEVEVLYALGDLTLLERPIVAIVGSREPTNYGITVAYEAAREAARAGLVVVSGMARGLDARAHRGALDGGGKTIAVLGCGFGVPYPKENVALLRAVSKDGLLLSELPPGERPSKWSFPARNRIIVALAKCLLVVEGKAKGGTSNTVRWMNDLGRTVLAVPGRIDVEVAEGPNRLIQDGAWPYLTPQDLLQYYGLNWDGLRAPESDAGETEGSAGPRRAPCERSEPSDRRRAAGSLGEPASRGRAAGPDSEPASAGSRAAGSLREPAARRRSAREPVARMPAAPIRLDDDVLEALAGLAAAEAAVFDVVTPDPVHVDRLAERAGLAPATLLAALSSLEIKGLVTQLPGKQFRLAS
jgi:DNA processing protein